MFTVKGFSRGGSIRTTEQMSCHGMKLTAKPQNLTGHELGLGSVGLALCLFVIRAVTCPVNMATKDQFAPRPRSRRDRDTFIQKAQQMQLTSNKNIMSSQTLQYRLF